MTAPSLLPSSELLPLLLGWASGRGGVVVDLVAGFGAGDGGAASARHRVASAWAFALADLDPDGGIKDTRVERAVQGPVFVAREPVAERVHVHRRPAKHGKGGGVDLGDRVVCSSRYMSFVCGPVAIVSMVTAAMRLWDRSRRWSSPTSWSAPSGIAVSLLLFRSRVASAPSWVPKSSSTEATALALR